MRKGIEMSETDFKIQDKVIEIAKELNVTPSQVALNWAVYKKGITSILVGPRTYEQFLDNLKALDFKLTEKQMKELDEVSKDSPPKIFPQSFIGKNIREVRSLYFLNKDYEIKDKE